MEMNKVSSIKTGISRKQFARWDNRRIPTGKLHFARPLHGSAGISTAYFRSDLRKRTCRLTTVKIA